MNRVLKQLLSEKKWHEFILATREVSDVFSNTEKKMIEFYLGISHMHLGNIDDALHYFRSVLESQEVESKIQLMACENLGVIAHAKKDFEFSKKCSEEYTRIDGYDHELGELWQYLESINSISFRYDKIIDQYRKIVSKHNRLFFQRSFASICSNIIGVQNAELFLESIIDSEDTFHSNLILCAFERYYDAGNVVMMKKLLSIYESNANSRSSFVGYDYMNLCIMMIEGSPQHEKLVLATRIITEIKTCAVIDSRSALRVCSTVFKNSEQRDRVLVPARFGIIGITPVISALRDRIDRFARSSSPVFIIGESGTGKELVAQALHDAGDRAAQPFIPVNCAAIPESVFESQLFGHVAGAFTGAAKDQPGLIELAKTGTLFLDEVGELPLGVQAKLLRFLENGEYRRLGSDRVLHSRARIVAATNRGLAGERGFREDLHQRLRRLEIEVPPLRDHREDIRYLARHRVRQLNLQDGSGWKQLDEAAEHLLESLDYPGNVRELFNLVDHAWHEAVQPVGAAEVERARALLEGERRAARRAGEEVDVSFAPAAPWDLDFQAASAPLRQIQEQAAVRAIRQALEHFNGDVDRAALFLDVSRRSIYRYLERERGDQA